MNTDMQASDFADMNHTACCTSITRSVSRININPFFSIFRCYGMPWCLSFTSALALS